VWEDASSPSLQSSLLWLFLAGMDQKGRTWNVAPVVLTVAQFSLSYTYKFPEIDSKQSNSKFSLLPLIFLPPFFLTQGVSDDGGG
jgi:hypothetical protein